MPSLLLAGLKFYLSGASELIATLLMARLVGDMPSIEPAKQGRILNSYPLPKKLSS